MTRAACALVALLSLLTVGCASTQANVRQDPRDPLERFNRASYALNDALDRAVLRPVARGYRKVTPQVVETGVSNFFSNLSQPTVIVNNLLQAKFKPALSDTARFLMNTTIGIGGLLDPASEAGLPLNDEDFGQTLGKWGVPSGPYLMIPLFGPSTVRDGFGSIADIYTDPTHYSIREDEIRWGLSAFGLIEWRARMLDTDETLAQSYDPYAFIRSAYLQRREYQVTDGNVPAPTFEDEFEDPEPEADD